MQVLIVFVVVLIVVEIAVLSVVFVAFDLDYGYCLLSWIDSYNNFWTWERVSVSYELCSCCCCCWGCCYEIFNSLKLFYFVTDRN